MAEGRSGAAGQAVGLYRTTDPNLNSRTNRSGLHSWWRILCSVAHKQGMLVPVLSSCLSVHPGGGRGGISSQPNALQHRTKILVIRLNPNSPPTTHHTKPEPPPPPLWCSRSVTVADLCPSAKTHKEKGKVRVRQLNQKRK